MSKNTLIAYYTHSGNTEKAARLIQDATGGTLLKLEPETPYPEEYNAVVNQAKGEIAKGYKPPLKTQIDDMGSYDIIFVGTPNWWSTIAPPIAAFLSEQDLAGKTIVPFCTHGGGGQARCAKDMKKLCKGGEVLNGLALHGDGGSDAASQVSAWLKGLGIAQ